MKRRYFGTDGIRGRVGEYPITADFMLKLGWAVGQVLAGQGKRRVLIGKDTRISGYMFESALEAGLSAAGVDIYLTGPMPTPGIAYLTHAFRAEAGIVISASHNSFVDNGIKFFSSQGCKLPDDIEAQIEAKLDEPMTTVNSRHLGKAVRIDDAAGRYIEFCKATMGKTADLSGLRIVVDSANGAAYQIAPKIFAELGATVISMGHMPDGLNINANCGSTHPAALQKAVLAEQADLGIALDGDGDRLLMVDSTGTVIDGDGLLYILATEFIATDRPLGGVVGTVMSNLGLERALESYSIPFIRTKVGDRYVLEALKAHDWRLGGETSGHIICMDKTTTGDGLIAALQVLRSVIRRQVSLHELIQPLQKFPQTMINVRLSAPINLQDIRVQKAVEDVEATLGARGRVVLRSSGTEPVVRVMVEGEDATEVKKLAEQLVACVRGLQEM